MFTPIYLLIPLHLFLIFSVHFVNYCYCDKIIMILPVLLCFTILKLRLCNSADVLSGSENFQESSNYEVEYIYEPITVGKLTGLTSRQCRACSKCKRLQLLAFSTLIVLKFCATLWYKFNIFPILLIQKFSLVQVSNKNISTYQQFFSRPILV